MEELKRQIETLIYHVEEQKAMHLIHGLTGEAREDDGYIQALKFVKLLINTNIQIKGKGARTNETVPKTQLIM